MNLYKAPLSPEEGSEAPARGQCEVPGVGKSCAKRVDFREERKVDRAGLDQMERSRLFQAEGEAPENNCCVRASPMRGVKRSWCEEEQRLLEGVYGVRRSLR